jgi:peptidoglycan/LPS O-acetylase OafA/YrhL
MGVLAVLSMISLCAILLFNPDPHITNHSLLVFGYLNIDLIWTFLLCTIISKSHRTGYINKIFSSEILVWLGVYSYGIYVFHWLILQLLINKYEILFTQKGYSILFSYWLTRILGIAITLFISFVSYHLYEKKFLSLKRYVS